MLVPCQSLIKWKVFFGSSSCKFGDSKSPLLSAPPDEPRGTSFTLSIVRPYPALPCPVSVSWFCPLEATTIVLNI